MAAKMVEIQGLGGEMNQRYSSAAVYLEDQGPRPELPSCEEAIMEYFPSTYPGCRLPHVWLSALSSGKRGACLEMSI